MSLCSLDTQNPSFLQLGSMNMLWSCLCGHSLDIQLLNYTIETVDQNFVHTLSSVTVSLTWNKAKQG